MVLIVRNFFFLLKKTFLHNSFMCCVMYKPVHSQRQNIKYCRRIFKRKKSFYFIFRLASDLAFCSTEIEEREREKIKITYFVNRVKDLYSPSYKHVAVKVTKILRVYIMNVTCALFPHREFLIILMVWRNEKKKLITTLTLLIPVIWIDRFAV